MGAVKPNRRRWLWALGAGGPGSANMPGPRAATQMRQRGCIKMLEAGGSKICCSLCGLGRGVQIPPNSVAFP